MELSKVEAHGLSLARYIEAHRQYIEGLGVTLETSCDAVEMEKLAKSFKGKPETSPPFELSLNDLMPHQVLWIYGRAKNGKLVHMHAMRFDDLGPCCLADWWQRHLKRVLSHSVGGAHCPPAFFITGRVVYHGEMYIAKKYRDNGLASALVRLAQALAYIHWDRPDWIYAFVSKTFAQSGLAARMGYLHATPAPVDWLGERPSFDQNDYLVHMSRLDLEQIFKLSPEEFLPQGPLGTFF